MRRNLITATIRAHREPIRITKANNYKYYPAGWAARTRNIITNLRILFAPRFFDREL